MKGPRRGKPGSGERPPAPEPLKMPSRGPMVPAASRPFKIESPFQPTGDQPRAIEALVAGLRKNLSHQVLLGVTGSGKTFTMAKVIETVNRPTLVIAHNKTLAAQLYQEFRSFFPQAAVEPSSNQLFL